MDPILTDAALDVPQIEKGINYVEELLREVLDEAGEEQLLSAFKAEVPDLGVRHLAKVYSVYFQLCNIVEEYSVISYRKSQEDKFGTDRISGLFGQAFKKLMEAGTSREDAMQLLQEIHIEPVFTAHPTESKRTTVVEQLYQLYKHFARLQNYGEATQADEQEARREIKLGLHRLWRTGEVFLMKPAVQDELRNVIHYLTQSLPPAIDSLDLRLLNAWNSSGYEGDLRSAWKYWPQITFGNWVGGDRDGHPYVTAAVTYETLQSLRMQALSLAHEKIVLLAKRLSFSEEWVTTPSALSDRIAAMAMSAGPSGQKAIARNEREPWRQYMNLIRMKLPPIGRAEPGTDDIPLYANAQELSDDLSFLYEQLVNAKAKTIADAEVISVIRVIQTFGFHLAHLDIRQNSRFHDVALSQLMQAANIADAENFLTWPEDARMRFLQRELQSPRPFVKDIDQCGTEAQQAVKTFKVVRDHLRAYGPDGIGSLIVSMTRQTSDLLVVYLLAREAGLTAASSNGWYCPVQVVPLFETIDDLDRSEGILDEFLSVAATRDAIAARKDRKRIQQVMVGYSDSNKDGGIFSSLWALQQAQRKLSSIGKKHDITILFFHGRGGSISRGAGPTHRFVASCPPAALKAGFRITEQGEVIAQKYAHLPTAVYNLEVQLAGLLMQRINNSYAGEWLDSVAGELSQVSFKAYEKLVTQPGFITFFSEATPIDVIELSGIGSRPARRTGKRTLADLRAIPWAFSWNQSRIYFPAWYGVGTALDSLKQNDPKAFQRLKNDWTSHNGLHYIITNVTSALLLADPETMRKYADLVTDVEIRDRVLEMILQEFALTKALVQEMLGGPIHERRPRMSKILELRNRRLRVLHDIQVNQLRDWRARKASGDDSAAAMLPQLLQVVNAIAGGLRATG